MQKESVPSGGEQMELPFAQPEAQKKKTKENKIDESALYERVRAFVKATAEANGEIFDEKQYAAEIAIVRRFMREDMIIGKDSSEMPQIPN